MNRIPTIEPDAASEQVAPLYQAVKQKLGLIPNMVKALGNSAAALQGYLGLSGAIASGRLPAATREKIALLVAEENSCDYCLSAHTALGGMVKIPEEAITAARRGRSDDPREQAILTLAKEILATQGNVPAPVYEAAVQEGVTSEEAAEVVANVAVNLYTNYFNRFAGTEIDFPRAAPLATRCAVAV